MRGLHPGGRGGRFFQHGGLRLVLLHLIAEKPRHGYELIREIEERVHGQYSPSPGVVYPTLTLLEEQGLISQATEDGGRKLCSITPAGQAHLADQREILAALLARMDSGAPGDRGALAARPPQVVRALENFKFAVRLRLAGEPLTPEQAHAFAAVLDRAAQDLERI
ncbi:MAG: PadR family transcriptional regulator [Burkholderiaceae bacterium]|nr:PadR family transcriptional regulator [Burkholderiaceae bacterium]